MSRSKNAPYLHLVWKFFIHRLDKRHSLENINTIGRYCSLQAAWELGLGRFWSRNSNLLGVRNICEDLGIFDCLPNCRDLYFVYPHRTPMICTQIHKATSVCLCRWGNEGINTASQPKVDKEQDNDHDRQNVSEISCMGETGNDRCMEETQQPAKGEDQDDIYKQGYLPGKHPLSPGQVSR